MNRQCVSLLCHRVASQWFIRWVGGEDQAQIDNYIEIHQPYPSNHANSHHNKTNEARKLKFNVKLNFHQKMAKLIRALRIFVFGILVNKRSKKVYIFVGIGGPMGQFA